MNKKIIQKLIKLFKSYPTVKLVYLFGSRVNGRVGKLSDYDFAIYFNEKNRQKIFQLKISLQSKLAQMLGTDKIDLVALNIAEGAELKYNIIRAGKLIYSIKPYKTLLEPKILNEYFDFYYLISKYNLTKAGA